MTSGAQKEIAIQDVTDDSLLLTVQEATSIRWQTTLKRGVKSIVPISGRPYQYEDLKAIWEQFSYNHDERGNLFMPFAFPVVAASLDLGPPMPQER